MNTEKSKSIRRRVMLLRVLCLLAASLQGCVVGNVVAGAGRLVAGAGRLVGGAALGLGNLFFGNIVGQNELRGVVASGLPGAPEVGH